jgi:hypothetical protein
MRPSASMPITNRATIREAVNARRPVIARAPSYRQRSAIVRPYG